MDGQCLKNCLQVILNGKKYAKIQGRFYKIYDEDSDKGFILDVDVKHPKRLHNLHCDLPFLPEKMKLNKCIKLVSHLYDKNNYVVHIRALKQALGHGIILKKVRKVIQFNQEECLKEYIDINTKLRTKAQKMILKKFL